MPTSSPSLRIAVMGAGNIGSLFAYQFARVGGHDVTVVARPGSARLTQLQRDAAVVKVNGDRANVRVSDALDEATAYDLVIVTLLAHQVNAVLPALKQDRNSRSTAAPEGSRRPCFGHCRVCGRSAIFWRRERPNASR
jgi:2-dehydropantoate 2-reductase